MLPSLFLSHGAPNLPLSGAPAKQFLQRLPMLLPARPRAILVVSAHWETSRPQVSAVERNDTIFDFSGFQPELYDLRYPAPGSPDLAARVVELLSIAGFTGASTARRGLDHGAWVPLLLMYPEADIPVAQLSVLPGRSAADHLALGQALAPLAEEGVLVLGSGSLTHDLSQFAIFRDAIAEPEPIWVSAFADWIDLTLSEGQIADLVDYRRLAPCAKRNHPTEEHLLPLFVALGAGGANAAVERLHASVTHGVLRMDVFSFSKADQGEIIQQGRPVQFGLERSLH